MKTCTSWGWGSWLLLMLLGAGGGMSCGPATKNTETGAAANTDTSAAAPAALQPSAAAPVVRRPNLGKPGKPEDKASAYEFVQNFKRRARAKDLRSAYFDTTLLKSMLQDCQCAGLRFYLADSLNSGNDRKPHMIVVRVDADGKDMDLNTNAPAVPGKRREQFKMGLSDERCPSNCGGCTLDQ